MKYIHIKWSFIWRHETKRRLCDITVMETTLFRTTQFDIAGAKPLSEPIAGNIVNWTLGKKSVES